MKGTANDAARAVASCKEVDLAWSPEQYQGLFVHAERRVRTRARTRRAVTAFAGAGAVALLAGGLWSHFAPTSRLAGVSTPPMAPARADNHVLRFADGSTVTLLTDNTELVPLEVTEASTHLRLTAGSARFAVAKKPTKHFRVHVGAVSVEVLGTVFELQRLEEQTLVQVQEGTVWVSWPGGGAEVVAGQSGLFPPALPVADRPSHQAVAAAEAAPLPSDWRRLARRQEFSRALRLIEREPVVVRDEPGDLLLAADAARLGGDPARAVPYLQAVARRHARDARAPAAAFTLGRLWLETLQAPAKAAEAFRRAHQLAPQGPLAEDARYREIEAWLRAGDLPHAQQAREAYERHHPTGRQAGTLHRLFEAAALRR